MSENRDDIDWSLSARKGAAVSSFTGSNSPCANAFTVTKESDSFLYGQLPAEVRPAAGMKGMLIRTADGEMVFRVYDGPERFTDYEIRHDDLSVTIDADELAAFYKVGEHNILDHSPQVLGLRKVLERWAAWSSSSTRRVLNDRTLECLAFAEGRLFSIHPFEHFNGRLMRTFLAENLPRLNLPAMDPTPEAG
jgi:hypothetical protein